MNVIFGQYLRPSIPSSSLSFPILRTLLLYKNDQVLCTQYHPKIFPVCTSGRLDYGCQLGSNNIRKPLGKEIQTSQLWQIMYGIWTNITVMDCDPQSVPRKIREAVHIRNSSGPSLMNRDSGLEIFYMWDTLFVKTLSSTPVHV